MKPNFIAIAALSLAAITLAACEESTQAADANAAPGVCRAEAAEALTGKARLTDEQAMQATGASIVRQISPGQGVTMDYRQERVTVETDPASGKILRAFCG
ncbi:I78 family peptidase inhibitor [Paracoccus aminovorans]|uniref:I78 family peptidase inhibitor n=1 Tax=Paracoccus aminovorans TaxID=34004 RepID=UPI002B256CF1|nr:I78 family peptidase inhibitor [Paracoccus aminovorans]